MLRRLLPLAVAGALLASGCSTFGRQPAATVNGTAISVSSLEEELRTIRDNDGYRQALEQSYGGVSAGVGRGTYDAQFVAQLLSLRVYYELLAQELEDRGVRLSDDDILAGREIVEQQVGQLGDDVFDSFPESYQRRLARQQALVDKLQEEIAAETGDARSYYRENREQFEQACVSHILVSTETQSPEEALTAAQALKARIDGGEDFAAVAQTESQDPGSAADGGDLGQCFGRDAGLVPEFLEASFEQPVGVVGEPVQTSFGYHLILVRERSIPPFEEIRDQVEEIVRGQSSGAISQVLVQVACEGDVTVSPRYGSWDTSRCDDGLPRVAPPAQPTTTSIPPRGTEGAEE